MTYLAWKVYPEAHDFLTLVFYLLLQDRIDEAFNVFNEKIPKAPFSGDIYAVQYDYLKAYLNCRIMADVEQTRELCMKYIAYPVLYWRNMFVDIANQLVELERGDGAGNSCKAEKAGLENENKTKDNYLSASDEEYLEATLLNPNEKKGVIKVTTRNLQAFTVKIFKTDLEVLFSKTPFLDEIGKNFSLLVPYNSITHKVENSSRDYTNQEISIPESLLENNLYIQVCGIDKSVTFPYFPSSLKIFVYENYGMVKVADQKTNKPLPRVYVKCFVRMNGGETKFYKDGYTDMRGSFDFARLNKDIISQVDKFTLLIVSESQGLVVKQCGKPSLVGKFDDVKLVDQNLRARQQEMINNIDL